MNTLIICHLKKNKFWWVFKSKFQLQNGLDPLSTITSRDKLEDERDGVGIHRFQDLTPLTPVTFETAKSSFASKLQNDVYDFFSEITPIKVILM